MTVLLILCAPQAWAQGGLGKDAHVSLRVDGRALSEIAEYLRDQSGSNIVVLEGADEAISLELTDVPWREALDIAAEAAGCVVEERQAGILVVLKPKRVTYETRGTDITEVIDLIAKLGGANIVVAPEVAGTLSLRLTDVPWRDALDVAVKTLGYVVVEENRGILRVVDPVSLQAQMVTRSYQLRYLRPKSIYRPQIKSEFLQPVTLNNQQQAQLDISETFTVLKALRKALSPGGDMDFVESQNVLIVRDTAQVHESLRDMLGRLDIEPAQVFVDVKFVSTFNAELTDLGIDYGDQGPSVSMSGGEIPITFPFFGGWQEGIIVGGGNGPYPNTGSIGPPAVIGNAGPTFVPTTVFGSLSFTNVQPTLKLLQRDTKSDVIQAPKVIALDGVESTIFVGETVRYAEAKSEQGQAGGLQLSLSEASNSPVDIGFQMLIVPHVIPGTNNLTMEVIPKETSLSGTGTSTLAPPGFDVFTVGASGLEGSIALPRTRSSTIVTTMLLESGQTAMIGGLSTDSDLVTESRVPGLWRIPLVGELFKHRSKDFQRRNLMVFITPSIVHSSTDQEILVQRELQRRNTRLRKELESLVAPAQ